MSTPPEDAPITPRRARRLAEAAARSKLEGEIWWFCCHLSEREKRTAELARDKYEYEMAAKLHFDYVLRMQETAAGRWPELCRLRSLEMYGGKVGLVLKFNSYMRKLDRVLANDGIFINHTRKILEDPTLGTIPQLAVDYVIPPENAVVDLTENTVVDSENAVVDLTENSVVDLT